MIAMIASLIVSIGRATRRRAAASVREGTAVEREGRSAAAAFSDQGDGDGDGGVTSASVTTPASSATTSRT